MRRGPAARGRAARAPGAGELDAVLGCFRAGGEQEDLVALGRGQAGQQLDQLGPSLMGKDVRAEEGTLHHLLEGAHDLGMPVADVGDEHPGGPVQPLVPPRVIDAPSLRMVDDKGRLALHGGRLEPFQRLEDGK